MDTLPGLFIKLLNDCSKRYEIYVAAFQKLLQVTVILFLATIHYMRSKELFMAILLNPD